ncbi:MBL fold metallo-hydrolase RNA specificity domain-containing protein [Ideonella sp. A 288]|uniref:MBL fold metallo-hydrolase RNA specificity domain-containing protein n=1 Tax=Ideonella sp. A 288 TaxID=1962181 RepID=UPI000B4BF03C|nr:MBL fold metallo-hydrolase [Ideonella sp. A 288]
MDIRFLGAADTVTGSRHLVTLGGQRILLDCGLFQGFKVLRERNWAPMDVDPREIDAVVLSHAHLDHSGWLPGLVKQGYRGPVYASPATRDLAEVLLLDSAHLQEEDARRANRYGYSRHEKALPLYTRADAHRAIAHIQALPPGRTLGLGKVSVQLTPAGHLLGACSVSLADKHESLTFSGDLGRHADLLMPPPEPPRHADVLLIESTYGNRAHPPIDAQAELGRIVRETIAHGGSVLLPSFAVGRAQALLVVLQRLKAAGEIPHQLPVFLDSPMAIQATELYRKHRRLLRVPNAEVLSMTDGVRLVTTGAQSQRLARSRYPCIIISASGMATGGRVLHHLKAMAPDERHHIVFAGFQVGGSRGARLVGGASEVKIHGEYVPVRARVTGLEGLSGHADSDELVAWARSFGRAPRQAFVVHGEPDAADALRVRLKDELGWPVRVPQHGEHVTV